MVFATARRVTQDAALAEDVTQETFLELARKGRSITESVGAWLHRVAWRRACDTVRAEVTRQRHEKTALELNEGRECTWEELEPVFDEAISELPAEQRMLIVEHYLEGRTQTELAARLTVSQSTVSRLLDHSITELRSRLMEKGLLCGAALAGMMAALSSTAAAYAVPVTLMASLQKIGLSSIGSGSATAVAGGAMATGLTLLGGMAGLKLAAVALAAVMACAAAYDLASEHSFLLRLFGSETPAAVQQAARKPGAVAGRSGEDAAARKARLLAEARAIWARVPKYSQEELGQLFGVLFYERDAAKKLAVMRSAGITISQAAYDRVVARHPDVNLCDERRSFEARLELFRQVQAEWSRESPLEFVAWSTIRGKSAGYAFPVMVTSWVRSHPDEWAALVEAGPDPMLGEAARLWIEDQDDPGSIWEKVKSLEMKEGLKREFIEGGLTAYVFYDAPVKLPLGLIMRAPHAKIRSKYIMGIAARMNAEQLLQAGNSGLFDPGLAELLRAMGGEPKAAFGKAAKWVAKSADGGGAEAQQALWTVEAIGPFYAAWLKVNKKAALQHAVRAKNKTLLGKFMAACAPSPLLTEKLMVESFSGQVNRERALAAYYQARAEGDPEAALRSIMNSTASEDQIQCAQEVLKEWAARSPAEASAWVMKLSASKDRQELMTAVLDKWANVEPEAACAFAQQQGVMLGGDWYRSLAWGGRVLPDDRLAAMLKPMRHDPEYNQMLTGLVGYRYPSQPEDALSFLRKLGAPGWQEPMMDFIIDWLEEGQDSRTEGYATQMPAMDLAQVNPAKVTKAARLFTHRLATQGKLQPALDWTLKLPAVVAVQVRAETVAKLADDPRQKAAAQQWIRGARISDEERASLLQQTSHHAGTAAAR